MVLQKVGNAIIDISRNQIRSRRLHRAAESTAEAVELVNVKYETGLTGFNNALVAQRDLFAQQDQLAVSQAEMVVNLITRYKALGGGWDPDETIHSPGDSVRDEP